MEMELIKKVSPAEGAGGMKAQRQESKGHVCSGNKGNPNWIEHGGGYVRQVLEKGELRCPNKRESVLKALWEE